MVKKLTFSYFEGLDSSNFHSDILAVYLKTRDHPQIRIDFLDLDLASPLEIRILLDVDPGGDNNIFLPK